MSHNPLIVALFAEAGPLEIVKEYSEPNLAVTRKAPIGGLFAPVRRLV